MKKWILICILHVMTLPLNAISSTTVSIQTTILPINELSVTEIGETLATLPAPAGFNPTSTFGTAFYSISTNSSAIQFQGNLLTSLPKGITVSLTANAPHSGYPVGTILLTAEQTTLVSNIGSGYKQNVPLQLQLESSLQAEAKSDIILIQYTLK